ncbi:unnamed protein product [Symbiodinium sp. CCMP2592]|nr:unnamed protein product [Symbiodinium sp. CCMP2592]
MAAPVPMLQVSGSGSGAGLSRLIQIAPSRAWSPLGLLLVLVSSSEAVIRPAKAVEPVEGRSHCGNFGKNPKKKSCSIAVIDPSNNSKATSCRESSIYSQCKVMAASSCSFIDCSLLDVGTVTRLRPQQS